jgi:hypothetical protein
VGVTTEIAAGPIGWVVLGVSALAAIFAVSAVNTQQATKSTQDYTQAIRDDNDALGVHVATQAMKALADDGALKAAQALGISTNDVTNAVLGQGGAAERVASQIRALEATYQSANNNSASYRTGQVALTDTQKANKDAVEKLKGAMDSESQAVKDQLAQQKILKEAQDATTTAQLGGAVAVQQAAAAYGMSVPEYLAATQAQQGTDQATRTATEAMQLQNDAAGILKQSLDKLNGKSISAADAQNAFDSSLVNMGDHVSATGKKITFTTTSISDMSSASVSLRGQLNGQISQLQGVVEANGGLANSTGKAREQMVTMRQQIIDNAVAHGVDRDAVTKYVDSILAIPKTVPPTKLDVDAAEAAAKIAAFQAQVDQLHGKAVTITTDYVTNGGKDTGVANTTNTRSTPGIVQKFAHGGQVAYLARGGFGDLFKAQGTDTQPAMLTPGEFVVNRDATSRNLPALKAMNEGGTLASGQARSGPVTVNLILDGKIIDSRILDLATMAASTAVNGANQDAKYRRVGV